MLIEIATFRGQLTTGCLTTSVGRLWGEDRYYRQHIKNGPLQLEVPDEEAEMYIAQGTCREVRKAPEPKPQRKPKVVEAAAEVKRVDPLE